MQKQCVSFLVVAILLMRTLAQDVCDAVAKAPDLVFGSPVEGHSLAGTPVLHVYTDDERACQFACKVQSLRTGCVAYNFKDVSDLALHECELFDESSMEAAITQTNSRYRVLQEICGSLRCLCDKSYCGSRDGENICLTKGLNKPFDCSCCSCASNWMTDGSTMKKYCHTLDWYQEGSSLFKLVRKAMTWGEAKQYCKSIGGHLPSISNEEQMKTIETHLKPKINAENLDLIGHWKLDGTDPDVVLKGNARYETVDGRTALYLTGQPGTYAEVPAFDLPSVFTISCWVKMKSSSIFNNIFGDWSHPYKFRLYFIRETSLQIVLQLRNTDGHDLFHAGVPYTDMSWVHVAVTYQTNPVQSTFYLNKVFKSTIMGTNVGNDKIMVNNHDVYDVGLKRDSFSQKQFNGHVQDLAVFRKVLTQGEVEQVADGNFEQNGIWIGLNDLESEGNFRWSDGSAVLFTNWKAGQPSATHKLEDCVLMEDSKWKDVSCGMQLYFACEKNLSRP